MEIKNIYNFVNEKIVSRCKKINFDLRMYNITDSKYVKHIPSVKSSDAFFTNSLVS